MIINPDKREPLNKHRLESRRSLLVWERIIDIIFSLGLIILFFIPSILIAVVIKIDDPHGKIFFVQPRVGLKGKHFKIYKFRSMVPGASKEKKELLKYNDVTGDMFKMSHDPRVTKVGHFLRRHSLDELPQLFNVLKGDMSLVGPRPPLPSEVVKYQKYDLQRLLVKPGCTGLWQVSGRNSLDFNEMVNLDVYYMNHVTLWMNIKIVLKTAGVMTFPNAAS